MARRPAYAMLLLALAGCGSDDASGPTDAAAAADGGFTPGPTSPAEPTPADFSSCPAGWAPEEGPAAAACSPFPGSAPSECGPAEMIAPGEAACRLIGTPCPMDGVPVDLPTDRPILHVSAGAIGGDGTLAAPFGTLGEVSSRGVATAVIALHTGRYDATATLRNDVALWGACPGETAVYSATSRPDAAVIAVRGRAEVRNLTVGGSPGYGVWVDGSASTLDIQDVLVSGTHGFALVASDAALVASGVVTRDTRATSTGAFGRGLQVLRATAEVSGSSFEASTQYGAFSSGDGASLALRDSLVMGTTGVVGFGRGVEAQRGGHATLERVVIAGNRDTGVFIDASAGAPPTPPHFDWVVVTGTRANTAEEMGRGIAVQSDAEATLRHLLLDGNLDHGLFVSSAGTVDVEDLVVRNTRARESDGLFGRGLGVQLSSAAIGRRVDLSGNTENGAMLFRDAVLEVEDLTVTDTVAAPSGRYGRGLGMQIDAVATLTRARFERNRDVDVFAHTGSAVTLVDFVSRDTESRVAIDDFGRGLDVREGTASLTRARFERNRDVAIVADASRVNAEDLAIRDTRPRGCASSSCSEAPFGTGVVTAEGADVALNSFEIVGVAFCGVHLTTDGMLDLVDGDIRDTLIGACIQVPGYDIDRLTTGVRFIDNATNLQTVDLPVPETSPLAPEGA